MKKILLLSFAFLSLTACQDLTELNKDIKNPQTVPAGTLFANATVDLLDFMSSTNVNVNNFRLWSQQWAQTTYADESNYDLITRNVNGRAWNTLYAEVIRDCKESKNFIEADALLTAEAKANQLAMNEVIEIFAFHVLVDIFGDMPYTEAYTDDVTPAYDSDQAIYDALITRLDAAINTLGGASNFGSYDLIYGGDTDMWRKFANSLKLRMAIRIADTQAAKAKTMAEAAVADGVFTSNDDNFMIMYQSATPNTNPVWEDLVQSGRSDFIATSTIIDPMKALDDPRISLYFEDMQTVDTVNGEPVMEFLGGSYGDNNNYNAYSHPGAAQQTPTLPGVLMDFSEVSFLLADAAARGFSVGGTAEEFYNAGIRASMEYWSSVDASQEITEDQILGYLSNPMVAYSTAEGTWRQVIAFQKWLAMYNRGFEAWSTYRLYDAPELPMAVQAAIPTPTRYTYPVTEYSLNGVSVEAVSSDKLSDKVFWDAN